MPRSSRPPARTTAVHARVDPAGHVSWYRSNARDPGLVAHFLKIHVTVGCRWPDITTRPSIQDIRLLCGDLQGAVKETHQPN